MTVTLEQHKGTNYYVTLEFDTGYYNGFYRVQACPCYNNSLCGHPERSTVYHLTEKKNAYATFKRYIKRYCTGERS